MILDKTAAINAAYGYYKLLRIYNAMCPSRMATIPALESDDYRTRRAAMQIILDLRTQLTREMDAETYCAATELDMLEPV